MARRYARQPQPAHARSADLDVDLAARTVRRDGRPVALTAREWALFEAFLQRPTMLLVQGAARGAALLLRRRDREQHDRGLCRAPAQEDRRGGDRDRARHGLPARCDRGGRGKARRDALGLAAQAACSAGSASRCRAGSWRCGSLATVVAGLLLQREIDEVFDSALQEVVQRILPLAYIEVLSRDADAEPSLQQIASVGAAPRIHHLYRARRERAQPAAVP